MSRINPALLTANGANFLITVLNKGQGEPAKLSILTLASASKGSTSLSVVISAPTGYTTSNIQIVNSTFFLADNQVITLDGTVTADATQLTVDPLTADLPINSLFTTYINSIPVLGLEAANLQLQKEVNQVILLSSKGWANKDYSTGSWQFSGNMMIPVNPLYAIAGEKVRDALLTEKSVFCERLLKNGRYFAGRAITTDASDTVSGNQYVSIALTLQGSGKILQKIIDTPVTLAPVTPSIPATLNPGYRVIILAGQSNAEGSGSPKDPTLDAGDPRMYMFAPGTGTYSNQLLLASEHLPNSEGEIPYPDNITFATHFVKNYLVDHPADKVVILTCAQGNTGFSTNAWNPGDYLYTKVVNLANSFISSHADSDLLAILWHQGERDHDNGISAPNQKTNILTMLDAMRTALSKTNLPFICGGLSPDWLPGDTLKTQYNTMFSNLNLDRSYVGYADSSGLVGGGSGNEIHFNAASLRTLGARYYQAYKLAKDYVLGSSTPVATNLVSTIVSSTIIKLSWDQVGVYQDFNIQYKLNSASTWTTLSKTSYKFGLVTGLTASTLYNFRIKTNGAASSVAYSQIGNASTSTTTITINDPVVLLYFWSGGFINQNDYSWGWASTINSDNTNIHSDSQRGDVILLAANQGLVFYRQTPDEMTQSAWVKLDAQRGFASIFGGENGLSDGRKDLMVNNGSFQAWGQNYTYYDATSDQIPLSEWVHLAWTVSKSTSTVKMYTNGILRKTLTGITHSPDSTNNQQFVGLLTFGGGSWENWLSYVNIWDFVLSDNQIAQAYQSSYR